MSNSYECSTLGLYRGIFKDISVALPTVRWLGRDESRLLSTVKTRGFRYLTIDMPAFGKHFDRCLAEGRLTPSGVPNFGYSGRGKRGHAFLRGLILRVFDSDGLLLSQPCITSIFFIRQLCNGAKKLKIDCKDEVRENALRRYIDQERSLRPPSLNWHGDDFDHRGIDSLRIDDFRFRDCGTAELPFNGEQPSRSFCDTVHEVADRLSSGLGTFGPMAWRAKHGPGAVADAPSRTFKYNFPVWPSRLDRVFPQADLAYANYGLWADGCDTRTAQDDIECPAVAITVPKSQKTPRIIAKEPTALMWCQQSVRDFLEHRISKSPICNSIHFRDQSYNGRLALLSSKTGSHWTVDLSDASDRLTLWLIERLFRRNKSLLEALQASRSTHVRVDTRDGLNLISMKKFAPQGEATTFPVQTFVYAILAISSVIHSRGLRVSTSTIRKVSKEVLVFGDDTIIPSDSGRQYLELLEYCGFTVNYAKTYGNGRFRESCGVDAYDGADVTPAYITKPYAESDPSSAGSVIECSNNFFMKGLWHSAIALELTLPRWMRKHLRVVRPDDGRLGLYSFSGTLEPPTRRWNKVLQREERLALSLTSTVTRHQPGGSGHLLQYFTEAPSQDIFWMSGVDGRASTRLGKKWEPTYPLKKGSVVHLGPLG